MRAKSPQPNFRAIRPSAVPPADPGATGRAGSTPGRSDAEETLRQSENRLQADLDAMRRLAELGLVEIHHGNLRPVLEAVLDAAITITGADFGTIQVLDRSTGHLKIQAQRGFPRWWIKFWDRVSRGEGACGTALERGERVIIEDVERSRVFAGTPALTMQRRAGVRAVQATPLVSRSGTTVGMFATHYRKPQRPDERALWLLDLLARQGADLIERAQAEAASRRERSLLSSVMHTTDVMLARLDRRFNFVWTNEAYARACRRKPEDLVGQNHFALYPHEETKAIFRRVRDTGKPVFFKDRPFKSPGPGDRGVTYLDWSLAPSRDATGKVVGLVFSSRDTTKFRKAVEALRESEERHRTLFQQARDGILLIDPESLGLVDFNNAACRQLGYTRREYARLNLPDLEAVQTASEVRRAYARIAAGHRVTLESAYWNKQGGLVHVEVRSSPIRLGKRVLVLSIWRNISARRQAEEKLRQLRAARDRRVAEHTALLQQSEKALAAFFSNAPIGLLWLDVAGRVQRSNNALLTMLDLSLPRLLGRRITAFDASKDLAGMLARLRKRGASIDNEQARLRSRNGTAVHVLIDATGVWEGGRLVRSEWFVRDISRRVMLERQVLDAGERERRRIGLELHDDLGQLLHGVGFLAEELGRRLQRRGLAEAAEMRRMVRVLNEAQETTRNLARGLQPVPPVPEGLLTALREHAARVQGLYHVRCRVDCRPPLLVHDRALAMHLFRIAQEAVTNACKHARCTEIVIRLSRARRRLVLSVRDNGNGRPPRVAKPTGMGLHVMQSRASSINASLAVHHRPGLGTEVVCSVDSLAQGRNPGKG